GVRRARDEREEQRQEAQRCDRPREVVTQRHKEGVRFLQALRPIGLIAPAAGGCAGRFESPLVAQLRTSSGTGLSALVTAVAVVAAAAEQTATKTTAAPGSTRTRAR